MDVQYDEDISRNRFYRKLQTDHQIFLDTALIEGWIICVPRNGSINEKCLADQEFLLAQILVPNDELSETHFTNLNCADIRLNEGQLNTGGFTARILFEELFYSKDGLKYKIWCIERPLCDTKPYGIVVDDEFSRLITINKLQDAVDFIRIAVKPRYVFSKIDAAVQNFIRAHQILASWNLKQYKEDVRKLHIQCLEILLLNRKFKDKCRCDAHLKQNVEIAVETYMMDKLYDHTKDVINICQLEQVESFNKTLRNLSDIHISEFTMKRTYADVIPTIKKELLRIDDFRTPIEKMSCLKRAFEIIAKDQTEAKGKDTEQKVATADDVIPLLIFVIIKTGLTNWIMNLTFLKEFQTNNPSSTLPKDKFGQNTYLVTTLEAVIVYISCCSIERSQRLGIDIVPSEDMQIQSFPEMKFRNADQFLNYLFTLMKNHEEENIFSIFQDFNNNNNNNNENQFGSKYKKCHPLCSCSKCDMLPYQPHIDDRNQNGLAAIHLAATLGSPKLLTLILNLKPNVDAVDAKNWTALHYAAANGHQNLLLLLLHAGININSTSNDQHTSLHLACLNGHSGCVKALLYFSEHMKIHIDVDAQTQTGQTSLHYASKWGFSDIVETLLEYTATVKIVNRAGATPLKYAHNLKIAKMLQDAYLVQQKRRKATNLYPVMGEEFVVISNEDLLSDETFVEYRNIEEMKRIEKAVLAIAAHDTKLACFYLGLEVFPPTPLIKTLPNDCLSGKDCHPLCTCQRCLNDSADFYTLLRKPYASKTNALTKVNLNSTNGEGYTALHVAAMCGNLDMINILLDYHVNILARTKSGATALHLACRERRLNVIKLLLNLCPSDKIIDLKDCRGDTPLHYAVEQNQLRIVEILLCAKADRSLRNLSGLRPIDIARTRLFFNVMNVLERKH